MGTPALIKTEFRQLIPSPLCESGIGPSLRSAATASRGAANMGMRSKNAATCTTSAKLDTKAVRAVIGRWRAELTTQKVTGVMMYVRYGRAR